MALTTIKETQGSRRDGSVLDVTLGRRDLMCAAAITTAYGVLAAVGGCAPQVPTSEQPKPEEAPKPRSDSKPTTVVEATPPSESDRMRINELEQKLENGKKLLYGLEALSDQEVGDLRKNLLWDKENQTEAGRQRLREEYKDFRAKLKAEREQVKALGLIGSAAATAALALSAIGETEEQFDRWAQEKGWTENGDDWQAGRKLLWLRFKQRENEVVLQVLTSKPDAEGNLDWSPVFQLYDQAKLPPPSSARSIRPGTEEKKVSVKAMVDTEFEAEAAACPNGVMEIKAVLNHPDRQLGGKTLRHLTNLSLDGQGERVAVIGSYPDGAGWAPAVTWKTPAGEIKTYIETRAAGETSIFDNSGMVVNLVGNAAGQFGNLP